MSVSFRIDDVCPEMDWERFEAFLEMLREFDVKPLLGVVPNNDDAKLKKCDTKADFWDKIHELQEEGYVIAMHGCNHVYITENSGIFPINNRSEFAGVPYEEQLQKIKAGKDIFKRHHIQTDVFMAPAHSFDENTIKALKECGFRYITDGFARDKYERNGMVFLPICNSIRRIGRLAKKWANVTVVVHTNGMSASIVERYRSECKKLKDGQLVSYNQLVACESMLCYNKTIEETMITFDEKTEMATLKFYGIVAKCKKILGKLEKV